jgi:hypothetical protein
MRGPFGDVLDIALEQPISGQERVQHDNGAAGFDAECRVAEIGDFHLHFLLFAASTTLLRRFTIA